MPWVNHQRVEKFYLNVKAMRPDNLLAELLKLGGEGEPPSPRGVPRYHPTVLAEANGTIAVEGCAYSGISQEERPE